MSIKAIGVFADKVMPFAIVQGLLKRFPTHHLYLINPSFDVIEKMNQNNVDSSVSLGPSRYELLIRLCYFQDPKRERECEMMFKYSGDQLQLAGESPSAQARAVLSELRKISI